MTSVMRFNTFYYEALSLYKARNDTGLLQVVDFNGLLQAVNKLQQVCWLHQVAARL